MKIQTNKELHKVKEVIDSKGLVICELMIDPKQQMPQKWTAGELSKV